MAYELHPNMKFIELNETKKKEVIIHFKKMELSKALYEIISFGDVDLIDEFIATNPTKTPSVSLGFSIDKSEKNNSVNSTHQLLFNAYHELYLKRVIIDDDMKRYLYEKFIKTSYSSEGQTGDIASDKLAFGDMPSDSKEAFERIKKEACEMIEQLCQISDNQERRNSFVFICLYLASKVNSLKKLFKKIFKLNRFETGEVYKDFPLEQIQFILSIYAYSYQNIRKEGASLYLCVLTEDTLMQHLKKFQSHLEMFKIDDGSKIEPIESSGKEKTKKKKKCNNKKKDRNFNEKNRYEVKTESEIQDPADYKNTIPNTENTITDKDETYVEQSKNSSNDYIENNYPNLNRDFWLVKNIYSLKIINEHIDIILQMTHLDSHNDQSLQVEKEIWEIEFLAMERCLVVIGEFTKNSAESPHLSEDLKDEICILTGSNVQKLLKKIRNDLSHFTDLKFGQNWHPSLGWSQSFKHIQLDFQKINDSFKFLFGREKYAAVECFAKKLIGCKTVENMHLIYPNYVLDAIIMEIGRLSENYKNVSLSFFETALQNLKEFAKQSDKTNMREIDLIDKLNESLDCWTFNKDNRPIKNKFILIGLAAHFRYFQFSKIKHNKSLNYYLFVEILDALLSNIKMKLTLNCEEQHLFEENIYNLLQITENPVIKNEACKLARLICKDMKNVEGIKSFKQNYNSSIHTLKKPFFQCKTEVDDIFKFIREHLILEADIRKFDEKVKKEVNEYNCINEIFDIIYKLKNNKDENACVKEQIDRAKYLISKKDSQLSTDSQLIKDMIDILSKEKINYDLCLEKAKSKYKDKKKCNYEHLVREFMNKGNYSVISKAKLISAFFSFRDEGAKSKLNTNSIQKIVEEGYLLVFNDKFNILKNICARFDDHLAGCDTESGIEFIYKWKLILAVEMVLHQVLELAHKYGGGDNNIALLTLRPDVLVHCGKSLRNFLAHQDIFYKLFSFETDLVLLSIAKEMSTKQPSSWIPLHNYLMRNELNDFDWCAEKLYFGETSFDVIRLQEIMFKAVEDDDEIKLKECIALGADPRGTNVYQINALQVAFDCSSVECFQLLVARCYKITICKPQMRQRNLALTLNIHDLPGLIKLTKIILKLPSIKDKLKDLKKVLDKVNYLYNFINTKFISRKENVYNENKLVVENHSPQTICYMHLLVYFQAVGEINKLFKIGVKMESELDINGNNPVHWAAALGFDDICQILLDNNFGLNEEDLNGNSPLDIAIAEGKWKTIKFLMSRKAVKYNPLMDPLLFAIMMEENVCSELWESAPFIEMDNSLNIFLFSYALCYSDTVMTDILLNYLNSLTSIKAVNFIFEFSDYSLDLNIVKKLTHNFILSLACFFGRKNIVCSMLKNLNFKEITKKFKYTPEEVVYLNNVSFINRLFKAESLLSWACLGKSKKNGEIAAFLLNKGYDPDARDANGFSPLHMALLQGKTQVCEVLIDKGANIELFTSSGLLPIHISSMYGFNEVTKILLDKKVTLSVLTKQSLRSPLHLAALGGHNEVIKMLLDYNKSLVAEKYKCIIDLGDLNGLTALHLALLQGKREAANILLEHGADVSKKSYNKMTSIHAAAACSGQEDILKLILSKIPEENRKELFNSFTEIINERDFFKAANISNLASSIKTDFHFERGRIIMETPLFYAESEKAVRLLLENGTNINLKNSLGRTALHEAIHKGKINVVKSLTEQGCIVDTVDCRGYTPLASAAYLGQVDIVSLLLKKKANINHCIQESFSTLFIAFKNELDWVNLVLNKKGNINNGIIKSLFWLLINSKNRITPTMISASKGFMGLTKVLLENKAKIDKSVWQNPLTVAIGNGHTETAQVLLETFSLEDVSNSNLPYLHFAIAINDCKMVEILLSKGLSPLIKFEDLSAIEFAVDLKRSLCYRVLVRHKDILEHPTRHIYSWLRCTVESSEPKVIKLKDKQNIAITPECLNYITYYQSLTPIFIFKKPH